VVILARLRGKEIPFAEPDDPIHKKIRAAIIAAPVLAIAALIVGKQKGVSALTTMSDPGFDKGLLVRSPADERVEFIKWDQIEEVTKSSLDRG
jgi:hypothetical protein